MTSDPPVTYEEKKRRALQALADRIGTINLTMDGIQLLLDAGRYDHISPLLEDVATVAEEAARWARCVYTLRILQEDLDDEEADEDHGEDTKEDHNEPGADGGDALDDDRRYDVQIMGLLPPMTLKNVPWCKIEGALRGKIPDGDLEDIRHDCTMRLIDLGDRVSAVKKEGGIGMVRYHTSRVVGWRPSKGPVTFRADIELVGR
jgi:hypothetical protein